MLILEILRKIYTYFKEKSEEIKPPAQQDGNIAAGYIFTKLMQNKPCMIARFGAVEMNCLVNYLRVKNNNKNCIQFITNKNKGWWWKLSIINAMGNNAGFFPLSINSIESFCKLMINDISEVNILGSWLPDEKFFEKELYYSKKINFELLNPYFSKIPWTKALEGKKVLVVHPFAKTIEQQYKKRTLLFTNNLLPEFELKTIKAVQTIAGNATSFVDWFEALKYMKDEIDKQDYDICLIGCGAYGFPLAAHVKRMGKKSVQLGGSLQLLFGIRGKRWEDENYNKKYNYSRLMNEHWVKPADVDKPDGAYNVEGACYW